MQIIDSEIKKTDIDVNLQLKVNDKTDILDFYETKDFRIDEKGKFVDYGQVMKYDYISDEIIEKQENEIVELRTKNSFKFKKESGIIETKYFPGSPNYFDGENWKRVKKATTTIEAFIKQFYKKEVVLNRVFSTSAKADYYAGAGDGVQIVYGASSYTNAITQSSSNLTDYTATYNQDYMQCGYLSGSSDWRNGRLHFPIETNDLTGRTILTAYFHLFGFENNSDEDPEFGVVESSMVSNTVLINSDYDNIDKTLYSDDLYQFNAVYPSVDERIFSFNDYGKNQINKSGFTKLAVLVEWDINEDTLTTSDYTRNGFYFSEYSGTPDYRPYLVITSTEEATSTQQTCNDMILATSTNELSTSTDIALITQRTFLNEDGTQMFSEYTVNALLLWYIFLLFISASLIFFLWKVYDKKNKF